MPDLFAAAVKALHDKFNLQSFRGIQEPVIRRLLIDKKSTLCLMPTGGGKSLCYQLPALVLDGLTLIIAPTISLMKDQVDQLTKLGLPVATLHSQLDDDEAADVVHRIKQGDVKLLWVAPERLNMESFLKIIRERKISLLAIDEAHCVSEYGESFRPDFLKLKRFADEVGAERLLCLTATATPRVVDGICERFDIDPTEGVFRTPVFRSNLALNVEIADTPEQKFAILLNFLRNMKGSTIIYVTTQNQTEELARLLNSIKEGWAYHYHAGLGKEPRRDAQNAFMSSSDKIIVATIAFAQGIDKPDIAHVIHYMPPKSVEGYAQEVGRAGRNGEPASCLAILWPGDRGLLEGFARGATPSRGSVKQWLQQVCRDAQVAKTDSIYYMPNRLALNYEITEACLGLLFAALELEYKLLRLRAPKYQEYRWTESTGTREDTSNEALLINGGSTYSTEQGRAVRKIALQLGDPTSLKCADKLWSWNMRGLSDVKGSLRHNRYEITNKSAFPKPDSDEMYQVVDTLVSRMEQKEETEVGRLTDTLEIMTGRKCIAYEVARYFGDSIKKGTKCGTCTVCLNGPFPETILESSNFTALPFDFDLFQRCFASCPPPLRTEARHIARYCFGIRSPSVRTGGKSKDRHPYFGKLEGVDWTTLMDACTEEMRKMQIRTPPASPQKRREPDTPSKVLGSPMKRATLKGSP